MEIICKKAPIIATIKSCSLNLISNQIILSEISSKLNLFNNKITKNQNSKSRVVTQWYKSISNDRKGGVTIWSWVWEVQASYHLKCIKFLEIVSGSLLCILATALVILMTPTRTLEYPLAFLSLRTILLPISPKLSYLSFLRHLRHHLLLHLIRVY